MCGRSGSAATGSGSTAPGTTGCPARRGCADTSGYKEVEIRQADYFFEAFDGAVPVAVELRRNAESLIEFDHPERALYVFGPEDGSLDRAVLAQCHRFLVIPTKHCTNLSAAVYTVLYDRHAKRVRSGLKAWNSVSAGFDEPDSMTGAAGVTWAS